MSRRLAVLVRSLALPLAAAFLAGGAPVEGAPPAAGHAVRVVPLEGEAFEAPLLEITAESLRLEGRDAPVPLAEVRELRFAPDAAPAPLPDSERGLRVVLRGGETVRGSFVTGGAEGITIRPPGLATVRLPFDVIRRVEAEAPTRGPCDEPGRDRPPRQGADVAWTRTGDAYAGTVARAGADGVVVESDGDERVVPWADLLVLHLDEPEMPRPQGLAAEVDTAGGSRWTGTVTKFSSDGLAVRTRSGLEVVVPREALVVVRWSGGRFVYASDLAFTSTFTPYYQDDLLDPAWLERWYGARADRTPGGCPLRVGGVSHRHGIAVHSASKVELPLDGGYARFEARFGIDDEALEASEGPRGDVTARVLADGREVWTSGGSVKGGEAARVVGPIDVTGVAKLVLEVGFGAEQHQMDRADWADPVLVRSK